jgi:hypothetical protein
MVSWQSICTGNIISIWKGQKVHITELALVTSESKQTTTVASAMLGEWGAGFETNTSCLTGTEIWV